MLAFAATRAVVAIYDGHEQGVLFGAVVVAVIDPKRLIHYGAASHARVALDTGVSDAMLGIYDRNAHFR